VPEELHFLKRTRLLSLAGFVSMLAVPAITMFLLVRSFGVNVPYGDQWEFVYLIEEHDRGKLDLGDLWMQHLDHRIFFPRIIWLLLANASNWNLKLELYLGVLLSVAVLALLVMMLRRSTKQSGSLVFWLFSLAFAWLMFSTVQWENWLWGFALQWFLNVLGAVGAISALALWPSSWKPLAGVFVAIVSAVLGTYSMAHGVFIWVACLPILMFGRHLRRYLPVWTGAAFATIGFFAYRYVKPPYHPPLDTFLHRPHEFAKYVLIYLGGALGRTPRVAGVVGFVLLAAFATATLTLVLKRRRELNRAVGWVALSLYCILTALATGIGRVEFGALQATESRYSTIATLFLLATAATVLVASSGVKSNPLAGKVKVFGWVAAALALGSLFVISYGKGLDAMRARRDLLLETRECLLLVTSKDDPCLLQTFPPSSEIAWDRSRYLMRKGWANLSIGSE
jgi:hypothetical protein